MKKFKSLIIVVLLSSLLLSLSLFAWFKKPDEYSDAERRYLEQFPKLNIETLLSGDFMGEFEGYTTDQFPLRESFRKLKSFFVYDVFKQKDNNDIYVVDDYVSKLEYPMNEKMLENAVNKFNYLRDKYFIDTDVNLYLSIVPDKNYFMAGKNGYLSMDYNKLTQYMIKNIDYMKYVDIFDLLSLDDYYRTDTHWKQEKIVDVAQRLSMHMGTIPANSFDNFQVYNKDKTNPLEFKGVYLGQSSLSIKPDEIHYATNETLEECKVYSYSSGEKKEIEMYNFNKAYGKDSYEMYLNGTEALVVIENLNAKKDKELVVFRDSFGSSLAPLMVEGYSKVTLIDIRYMKSDTIGEFVEFDNQDVLFIYSTIVLNNSMSLN